MSKLLTVGVLWVLALAACTSGDGSSDSNGAPAGGDEQADCSSTACKLATIDEGGFVAESDPIVSEYETALSALDGACPESATELADMVVVAQELIANGGQHESLLSILRAVHESIPPGADVGPCADLVATYVALRGGQA